jgi:hypothetical protein
MIIQKYQQGNYFSMSLKGHYRNIPVPEPKTYKVSDFDFTYNNSNISDVIREISGTGNYNTVYDSAYAPVDFKLSCLSVRIPNRLPEGEEIQLSFKINGSEIEVLPIPEARNDNIKIYGSECDLTIWEDSKIEVEVSFEGDYNNLSWNDHNITFTIGGVCLYSEYTGTIFDEIVDEDEYLQNRDKFVSWNKGANWYKNSLRLQNRSGNDIFKDRSFLDITKCPYEMLIQSVQISLFEDKLTEDDVYNIKERCLFIDIISNGKSIFDTVGGEKPVSINSTTGIYTIDILGLFDDTNGFKLNIGDDIFVKIYQKNTKAKYNGNIAQCYLFGSSPDSATEDGTIVSVYSKCDDVTEECSIKYEVDVNCDVTLQDLLEDEREIVVSSPYDPKIDNPDGDANSQYVTVNGVPVIINGEKVFI